VQALNLSWKLNLKSYRHQKISNEYGVEPEDASYACALPREHFRHSAAFSA
jgi:hypothetical protein